MAQSKIERGQKLSAVHELLGRSGYYGRLVTSASAMVSIATLLKPRASRLKVAVRTRFVCDGAAAEVTVSNVTVYGFMAETHAAMRSGQIGILALPNGEALKAEIRWAKGNSFGAQFIPPLRTFTLAKILSLYAE